MSRLVAYSLAVAAFVAVTHAQSPIPPPWAYTVNPPPPPGSMPPAPAADPAPRTVPGSTVSMTLAQTRDANNPPDWFPDAHPPMPQSVARGRKGEIGRAHV